MVNKYTAWRGEGCSLLDDACFSPMDIALSAYDVIRVDSLTYNPFYDENSHADPNEVIPDSLIDWLK
jgi:hypothetical protein